MFSPYSLFSSGIQALSPFSSGRQALREQLRWYTNTSTHPEIAAIYSQLISQSTGASAPMQCNFISQVVDVWGRNPNRCAIQKIDLDRDEHTIAETITYEQLSHYSRQVGGMMRAQGIKRGDAVALMVGQDLGWWYSLAALMRRGVAAVPCSRLLTQKDLAYRIRDLGMKGMVTIPGLESRVEAIREECPSLQSLMTVGPSHDSWHSIYDAAGDYEEEMSLTTTEDPCVYLYTSGTTGDPKAVQHNSDYPFFHWPTGRRWLQATPEDLVYNASDTGWGFTVWITTAAWATGAQLLITPTYRKFEPEKMLNLLREQPITIFCAAPTVLRILAAQKAFSTCRFHSLKRIVTVGEALDETVINQFAEKGVEIRVAFGQAETPTIIGCVDDTVHQPNTMGKAIDPYRVVILGDDLQPLSPGHVGQIAVDRVEGASAGIMRGYKHDPEKTERAFSPDKRFYLTGDWALMQPDGYFRYQGRRDDLIKSHGYRIGPDEVEKAGMSYPAVAKIAVVGVRTQLDSYQTTVKAFILLKPGYTPSEELMEKIQNHIKQETAPNKYPRLIEFLPLDIWERYETTSGKIRRRALRELEAERLKEKASSVSNSEGSHSTGPSEDGGVSPQPCGVSFSRSV